ncbi:hypothetical protein H0H93_014668 [Arthromyces matolae]|nr:hypothetical protein H0H93_014668 [Arthromyces matolae]
MRIRLLVAQGLVASPFLDPPPPSIFPVEFTVTKNNPSFAHLPTPTHPPSTPTMIQIPNDSNLWALRYPDIDSINSPASSSSPQSLLPSTSPKIEESSSPSSLSSPTTTTTTTTFTGDHLKVAFRELHGHAVCRMCILQRKQGSKPGNLLPHSPKRLPVMSFPLHTPPFDLFEHCLEHHAKETIELVGLSKSTLTQMQAGFAKTERVEDAHAYRDMLFPSYRRS